MTTENKDKQHGISYYHELGESLAGDSPELIAALLNGLGSTLNGWTGRSKYATLREVSSNLDRDGKIIVENLSECASEA